jgi:MATE family multidrug resistance protein
LSLITGVLLCLAIALIAAPLSAMFFENSPIGAAAASLAAGILTLLAAMEIFGNPGSAAAGLLRGRKDSSTPMIFSLVGYWLIGAPVGIVLCEMQGLGITGLWFGLLTGTAVTGLLTVFRLLRGPVPSSDQLKT